MKSLPKDSQAFAEQAYEAKVRWHRKQARMSLRQKLRALDRMRETARLMRSAVPLSDEGADA